MGVLITSQLFYLEEKAGGIMLSVGSLLHYRYEIMERVGSGGMSVVYKAKDIKLGRYVAIKILKEEYCLDENFIKRFKVEAQSAASLSHSNIVNIYDVGNEGRTHFIVMEFLEGETLKDYIKNNGQLSNQEILKISVCIASALEHAHNNHIIHRDIKPQNIMLTIDGKVKVMDFGIARVASGNTIEMNETPTGSVYYIAPEQARGGYQDNKSDFYSLGITMYEMATGVLPFTGDSAVNVALKQIHDEMPKPSDINTSLSANIETIIMKATQKKTSQRYKNAKEILDDLKTSMNNPDDVLVYTTELVPSETIAISPNEMKHIWNKSEVNHYAKEKDPLDKVITVAGIFFALAVVSLIAVLVYNNFAKEYIPVNIEVPNVVGLTVEEATQELTKDKLAIQITESVYNNDYDEGYIISQLPDKESVVLEDEVIEVVVSKGIETNEVIDVVKENYEKASEKLKNAGFKVDVEAVYNDEVSMGSVISQKPDGGDMVPKGTKVTLTVSRGPEEVLVEVPDIRNIPLLEAKGVLKNTNLILGNVTYVNHDSVKKDNIVSMTVEPGKEVKEGYVIDVAVSLGPKIVEVTEQFAINNVLHQGEGQESCELKLVYKNKGKESILFQGTVDASNFPFPISITDTGVGTLEVYNDNALEFTQTIYFESTGGN